MLQLWLATAIRNHERIKVRHSKINCKLINCKFKNESFVTFASGQKQEPRCDGKSFKKAKEEERQRFNDNVWGKSDVGKLTGRVRLGRDGKKERESGRV